MYHMDKWNLCFSCLSWWYIGPPLFLNCKYINIRISAVIFAYKLIDKRKDLYTVFSAANFP